MTLQEYINKNRKKLYKEFEKEPYFKKLLKEQQTKEWQYNEFIYKTFRIFAEGKYILEMGD